MSPQHRLGEHGWLDAYAAPTVTPGGGSASAVAAALGCACWPCRPGSAPARPSRTGPGAGRLAQEPTAPTALVEQERTDAGSTSAWWHRRAARATEGDPGATRAAEAARADATRSRWPPPSWPPRAAPGRRAGRDGLARTPQRPLVAAHLLRAGLEGGLSTIAFNLGRMAAGPVRDDLAARAGRLEEARRDAAALTERLTGLVEQP